MNIIAKLGRVGIKKNMFWRVWEVCISVLVEGLNDIFKNKLLLSGLFNTSCIDLAFDKIKIYVRRIYFAAAVCSLQLTCCPEMAFTI